MEDFSVTIHHPTEAPSSEAMDDLTRIKGIGQVVQDRLHRAGIYSYAQLAASSPKRISKVLADMIGMTPEKIKEQDWIGQARRLIPQVQSNESSVISANLDNHQHYETFSVKLLEDVSNRVRRTNIVHVQKGVEQNWAGWDEARLIAFIVENAKLNVTSAKVNATQKVKSVPAVERETIPARPEATQAAARPGHPHHHRRLAINALTICQAGSKDPSSIIPADRDWSVELAWTLTGPGPLFGHWLVKIFLESLGPGREYVFPGDEGLHLALIGGEMNAPEVYSYFTELKFKAGEIEPGIYWLVASIAWEKHPGKLSNLMQVSDKLMLQVYPGQ